MRSLALSEQPPRGTLETNLNKLSQHVWVSAKRADSTLPVSLQGHHPCLRARTVHTNMRMRRGRSCVRVYLGAALLKRGLDATDLATDASNVVAGYSHPRPFRKPRTHSMNASSLRREQRTHTQTQTQTRAHPRTTTSATS